MGGYHLRGDRAADTRSGVAVHGVGAVLDVVQLLGLRGEFGDVDLIGMSQIVRSAYTKGVS